MQRRAAKLWAFLCPSAVKIMENSLKAFMNKANRIACFDDWDHHNRNFYGECNGSKCDLIALAFL